MYKTITNLNNNSYVILNFTYKMYIIFFKSYPIFFNIFYECSRWWRMRGHACPGSESVPRLLIATAIALVLVACALKAICCSLIMLLLRPEGSPTSQRLLILDVLLLCSVCSSLDLPRPRYSTLSGQATNPGERPDPSRPQCS